LSTQKIYPPKGDAKKREKRRPPERIDIFGGEGIIDLSIFLIL
jgi:hypothetical protein